MEASRQPADAIQFSVLAKDDLATRGEARDLLCSRLASQGSTADNRVIIAKLLGFSKGELHCHRTHRPLVSKNREAYKCAVGTLNGRVVVASCFRHADSPSGRRAKGQISFTELLLLAVDVMQERKGHGRRMVNYIHACARGQGSEALVVRLDGCSRHVP